MTKRDCACANAGRCVTCKIAGCRTECREPNLCSHIGRPQAPPVAADVEAARKLFAEYMIMPEDVREAGRTLLAALDAAGDWRAEAADWKAATERVREERDAARRELAEERARREKDADDNARQCRETQRVRRELAEAKETIAALYTSEVTLSGELADRERWDRDLRRELAEARRELARETRLHEEKEAEARAEIERLNKLNNAYINGAARCAACSESRAIVALGSLPPGAPAPEHPGEAYAVAVRFWKELQFDALIRKSGGHPEVSRAEGIVLATGAEFVKALGELDAARARVAELEEERADWLDVKYGTGVQLRARVAELDARVAELEADNEQRMAELDAAHWAKVKLEAEFKAFKAEACRDITDVATKYDAENKRLRLALKVYGRHDESCMHSDACACGLDDVLEAAAALGPGGDK